MADNYLENKFDEYEHRQPKAVHKGGPSLDSLFTKNRSTRGFDQGRKVTLEELKKIVEVNTRIASSKNQQALRFKLITAGPEADFVNANFKMGALFRARRAADPGCDPKDFPQLPLPGTEPEAFVLVYGTHPEDSSLLIDLGISLQSMALKAMELGLNTLIIRAFNRQALLSMVPGQELYPVAILAVGKSAESIYILPTKEAPLNYFRKEGVHYVPKLGLEQILL